MNQPPSAKGPSPSTAASKTKELDPPLHALGFEIDDISPTKISGHILVTTKCCQVTFLLPSLFVIYRELERFD